MKDYQAYRAMWAVVRELQERVSILEKSACASGLAEIVAGGCHLSQKRPAAAKSAKRIARQQVPALSAGTQLHSDRRDQAAEVTATKSDDKARPGLARSERRASGASGRKGRTR